MQTPSSVELFATRLSDPKLTATLKTKIALELKDSKDLFTFAEKSPVAFNFGAFSVGTFRKGAPFILTQGL
ncbi:hypothetical protein DSO57_1020495 [Entomophthora muscae]|uniref:Uncharacterized protein n=1 Tax=Entomophthora muscae TaxID=34485 RepID=A0ACC2UPW9_9FUNG|nr:hypothetical protein DSO57_1020495 [Entomophthora muscae]